MMWGSRATAYNWNIIAPAARLPSSGLWPDALRQ